MCDINNVLNQFPRTLHIMKLSDGLYHFIGAIYEKELSDLSIKGFDSYSEAEHKMIEFNYIKFKTD